MMTDIYTKKQFILEHEKKFSAKLASLVLNKPKLSSWMIFIPFIFIFYFQDLMKFKKGRAEFIENYLLTYKKALNEAYESITESRKPDADGIAEKADLKGKSAAMYAQLLSVLVEHYQCLLNSEGDSYHNLIKSAYGRNKTNLLLFFNQLAQSEKQLNKALSPKLKKDQPGAASVIKRMEKYSEQIRRDDIKDIYGI